MRRRTLSGLIVALVLVSFLAAGCGTKEKQELQVLQQDYNKLSEKNQELRTQLLQADEKQATLMAELVGKEDEIGRLKADLAAKPTSTGVQPPKGWEKGLRGDKISVGSDVLFSSGRATLTAAGNKALDKVIGDLKSTYTGLPVRVYGYTDSDPIRKTKNLWKDNLDLSANRAMAVTRYLVSKGIKAEKVETVAMGATHFITSNATKAGKAKNRRVEIVAIK